MGSNTLGTLYINLDLKNNLSKGLKAAQGQLAGAGKSFSAVGAGATSAGKSLTKNVTAPLAAVGAASVYTAVQFDDSMRKVKALTGATGNEFETLTDQARELGRTTRYKASEAADGMSYLAMAGFEVNEIMETMPDMLSLASASATDLATTADIASNILTGFGMEATEMGRAADVMALACASSNTDLTQLGEAMSYAAPVAKGFGMSIEETAAAVGFLSNAGIQSSMAGTTLRGMLTKLADPTNEATKKLEKYGIALEDVNPEVNSFTEILKTLKDAGVYTSDMMGIMGQRAGPGTAALLSQGYENLEIYTEKLENAEGAASRMAETMEEGPGGSMRKLSSALESVAITLGDTIADALLPFADTLANVAGKLSAFGEAHPTLLKIIVVLGGLAAAAGPVLMAVGMMASGIGAISTVLGAVGGAGALGSLGAVAGVLAPIAPIILGVTAAAGLLYLGFKHWDKIKEIAGNLYNWIKDSVVNTVKTLTGVDLTDSGTSMIKKLGVGLVMGTIGLPVVMAKLGLDLIKSFVKTDFAKSAYEWIQGGIVSIVETLTGVDLTDDGTSMIKKLGAGILVATYGIPLTMAKLGSEIIKSITGIDLYGSGVDLIGGFIDGIASMASPLTNTINGVLEGAGDYFPHSPAKKGPFHILPNWSALFDGIEEVDAESPARQAVSGMSSAISGTAPSTMAANAAAGGGIGGNTYGGDTYEIKIGNVNNQADIDYLMSEIEKRNRSNRLKRGIGL